MCADIEDNFLSEEFFVLGQFLDNPANAAESTLYPCNAVPSGKSLPPSQCRFGQIPNKTADCPSQKPPDKIHPNGILAKIGLPCQA